MIKVVPFHKKHMDLFEQRPDDLERYGKLTAEDIIPVFDYGQTFTCIHEGRIVMFGGILEVTKHTGRCATLVSIYADECITELLRELKKQLEMMMRCMGLHRIETSNMVDALDHIRWCRLLGFVDEGEMKLYDDRGRTFLRMAKTLEAGNGT